LASLPAVVMTCCSDGGGPLDGERADAAGGAVDQDGLDGAESGDHGEVEVDGARGFGQDGGFGDAERGGEWQHM
jgi:hypothetical protein